jgi:pimeloyl-ACP methyl ester carboxylesterase
MIYVAFIIFTLAVLLFAFYQWQYFMIFSPLYYREEPLCQKCSLLTMMSNDGVELEGAIYEPLNAKETLLVFVGRSHDAVALINRLAECYSKTRIITFNYRSYGKSGGVANEKNLLNDGFKIAQLVEKNYGQFFLLGFSIGSSVAAYVASKTDPKALFLVGAFDSIDALASHKFGINFSKLLRYKFETIRFVQEVKAPTYLFVSRDDTITYIENARNLKKSIANLKKYKEFVGLHHKELLWDKRVINTIKEVLDEK